MKLELQKIGNSVGIVLPDEVLDTLRVREGDFLTLLPIDKGYQLTVEDGEFEEQMRIARSLMARYRKTMRELAK